MLCSSPISHNGPVDSLHPHHTHRSTATSGPRRSNTISSIRKKEIGLRTGIREGKAKVQSHCTVPRCTMLYAANTRFFFCVCVCDKYNDRVGRARIPTADHSCPLLDLVNQVYDTIRFESMQIRPEPGRLHARQKQGKTAQRTPVQTRLSTYISYLHNNLIHDSLFSLALPVQQGFHVAVQRLPRQRKTLDMQGGMCFCTTLDALCV